MFVRTRFRGVVRKMWTSSVVMVPSSIHILLESIQTTPMSNKPSPSKYIHIVHFTIRAVDGAQDVRSPRLPIFLHKNGIGAQSCVRVVEVKLRIVSYLLLYLTRVLGEGGGNGS